MKKLTTLFAVLPGAAFAHGGHAPLPETVHSFSHAAPAIGALVVAAAIGLALVQRWRS